jgi:hypothetical protein
MVHIAEGYPSMGNYRADVETKPENFKPDCCDKCGCQNIWIHSFYIRCVVRKDHKRLIPDPIKVLRFQCAKCLHTMSTLPEFICPRRWYLWCMQEAAISRSLNDEATQSIANDLHLSRDTVYRWVGWIFIKHDEYHKELSAIKMGIGMGAPPNKFWLSLFRLGALSRVMFQLHKLNITVP